MIGTCFAKTMWIKLFVVLWLCTLTKESLFPIVDFDKLYNFSPPENDVTFYLYDRSEPSNEFQIFVEDEDSVDNSPFDSDKDTKIILHGWTHGKDVPWVVEMKDALVETRDYNVIVVDWAPLSHVIYVEARVHTPVVSKQVAELLLFLNKYKKVSMSSIHLIGHSMGAQIAAYAGNKIKKELGQSIRRISALDPAAPLYEWPHIEYLDEVLDPGDAEFVDVIHTNGRHLGMMLPAGHVDFYPSGGENQPGCATWVCSHIRACEYFIATIRKPDLFKGYSYKLWDEYHSGRASELPYYFMGFHAGPEIPRGSYTVDVDVEFLKYTHSVTTIMDSKLM